MTRPFSLMFLSDEEGTPKYRVSLARILRMAMRVNFENPRNVISATITADQLLNTAATESETGYLLAWTEKYVYVNVNDFDYEPYVVAIPRNPPQQQEGAETNG